MPTLQNIISGDATLLTYDDLAANFDTLNVGFLSQADLTSWCVTFGFTWQLITINNIEYYKFTKN